TTGAGAGDITFASTLDGGQALTLTAGTGNVLVSGAVGGTTRLGAVTIAAAHDVTEAAGLTAAALTQTAGTGTTTLTGAVNLTGAANLTTESVVIGGGGSLAAGASSTITAQSMNLAGRPIGVGGNRLTLQTRTPGQIIDLGGADSGTRLGLTTTDLAGITAGVLQIGDATQTGGIVLSADTATGAGAPTVSLVTGGSMTWTGGTFTAPALRVDAATGIGVPGSRVVLNATTLTARTRTSGGLFLTESDGVSLGTVDGQTNLDSASGAGDVTLTSGGTLSQGAGTLLGASARLEGATGIGSVGTPLSIQVDTVAAYAAASGGIFLAETLAGGNLSVGTVDSLSGITVTAGNDIGITVPGGSLTLTNPLTTGGAGAATLSAGGSIASANGAAVDVTASSLSATAGSGSIALDTAVSTAVLTAATPTAGTITLNSTGSTTLTSVTAGGDLSITNSGPVLTLGTAATKVESGGTTSVSNSGGDIVFFQLASDKAVSVVAARHIESGVAGTAPADIEVKSGGDVRLQSGGHVGGLGGSGSATTDNFYINYVVPGSGKTVFVGGGDGIIAIIGGDSTGSRLTVSSPPSGRIVWNGFTEASQESTAGSEISSVLKNPAGEEVFEAVESQMIEVLGDPSEQIEEELQFEEEDGGGGPTDQDEEERRRRGRRSS
ncbi:MAG: hypothetical protein WC713_13500, partial [Candidatus Methylomirabilota bacterium]